MTALWRTPTDLWLHGPWFLTTSVGSGNIMEMWNLTKMQVKSITAYSDVKNIYLNLFLCNGENYHEVKLLHQKISIVHVFVVIHQKTVSDLNSENHFLQTLATHQHYHTGFIAWQQPVIYLKLHHSLWILWHGPPVVVTKCTRALQ